MTRTHEEDRGLTAVRRVRVARENDSRIGLQTALADARTREAEARRAADRLTTDSGFGGGDTTAFQAHQARILQLADLARRADEAAAAGRRVAEQARAHWLRDRTAVRSVDFLLERRELRRAAERDRREAAQLDDLAATAWLRRTTELSARHDAIAQRGADSSAAGEGER